MESFGVIRTVAIVAAASPIGIAVVCAGASAHGVHRGRVTLMLTTRKARTAQTLTTHEAHTAQTLDGTDTAHLHLVRQDESLLYEEGSAGGALPGHMGAKLTVGSKFTGACTIYTRSGSITGRGSATAHGTGRFQSFSGTFTVTGGSGRYRRVHGITKLYGTFDRRTFAVVVQTVGRLSY